MPPDDRPTPSAIVPYSAELRAESVVELAAGDVACKVRLVVVDRRRKLSMYDVLLANTSAIDVSCRLYGVDGADRKIDIALFEVAAKSLGTSRFFVPLGKRDRWETIFIEIAGEGVAMLIQTLLPRPQTAVPKVWRRAALGSIGVAAALIFIALYAASPFAFAPRQTLRPAESAVAHRPAASVRVAALGPHPFRAVDDAVTRGPAGFAYTGGWQHIKDLKDGRSEGTSSRTFHAGDKADFTFDGERFKIYGVKGPNGGYAELSIDGDPRALLLFYAPKKETGVEMFASPALRPGVHTVDIVDVDVNRGTARRRYVNLDGAAYLAR